LEVEQAITKEAFTSKTKQTITEALRAEGATKEEIQTVLQNP
jgi:hypothetical protein